MSFNTIRVNNTDTNYAHSIFDISEYNSSAKYEDLTAALAAIPQNLLKGGMTVRFMLNDSNNTYVQYRLMSNTFNTTESNWQGVDKEPKNGSHNLIESLNVFNINEELRALNSEVNGGISRISNDKDKFNKGLYRVTYEGNILISSEYILYNPQLLLTGQTITVTAAISFLNAVISVTSVSELPDDPTSLRVLPILFGLDNIGEEMPREYTYTASENCYVIVCASTNFTNNFVFYYNKGIKNEIFDLEEKIDLLENDIYGNDSGIIRKSVELDWVFGYRINQQFSVISSSSYYISKPIYLNEGEQIKLNAGLSDVNYAISKTLTSELPDDPTSLIVQGLVIGIDEFDEESLREYTYTAIEDCYVIVSAINKCIPFNFVVIEKPTEGIKKQIESINFAILDKNQTYDSSSNDWTNYFRVSTTGIISSSAYCISRPFLMPRGSSITLLSAISKYNYAISKTSISELPIDPTTIEIEGLVLGIDELNEESLREYTYTSTEDCYIIVCAMFSQQHSFSVNILVHLGLSTRVTTLETETEDLNYRVEQIEHENFNSRYKIAILGDSILSNQVSNGGAIIRDKLGISFLQETISDGSPQSAGNVTTEFGNLAVGGAILSENHDNPTDKYNTHILLTKHLNGHTDGDNVLSNLIFRLLAHTSPLGQLISWTVGNSTYTIPLEIGVGRGYVNDIPDIIYIGIGTNDGYNNWVNDHDYVGFKNTGAFIDDYDSVMASDYSDLTRYTICSSLRWTIETLMSAYPLTVILIASALPASGEEGTITPEGISTRNGKNLLIREYIKRMCNYYHLPMVDVYYECGINKFNWNLLLDSYGLHPNSMGKQLMTEFICGQIKSYTSLH